MDGLRDPVGEQPREVYMRRRIVAGALVLLLIVAGYFVVTSLLGGDDAGAQPEPSPETTTMTSQGSTAIRACAQEDVGLTVTPSPADVGPGTLPAFDVAIEHIGASPCTLSTTAKDTQLLITSGSDRIYSSADCPDSPAIPEKEWILEPGGKEMVQMTWDRTRSAPECAPVNAEPGNGTYKADVEIQGIVAPQATFRLVS